MVVCTIKCNVDRHLSELDLNLSHRVVIFTKEFVFLVYMYMYEIGYFVLCKVVSDTRSLGRETPKLLALASLQFPLLAAYIECVRVAVAIVFPQLENVLSF